MPLERSRSIGERLGRLAGLIQEGCSTSPDLSDKLNVSRGTVHRIIAELRRRGFLTRSVREDRGWSYQITQFPQNEGFGAGP